MKCPNDQTEMEKGMYHSAFWMSGGKPFLIFMLKIPWRKTEYVIAWRCSKCGKIELYSEINNKK